MLISVVILAFNEERYLGDTLRALRASIDRCTVPV
jgi:glycosyltransferase involved in cell wall biosynthesis